MYGGPRLKIALIASAAKYRQTLSARTLTWLDAHNGHYEHFMHPDCPATVAKVHANQFKDMPQAEVLETILKKDHISVSPSPRFTSTNLSYTSQNNYEYILRFFWWFLAMIGDYDSMLILLADPPTYVPSCASGSIQMFCEHRFRAPLFPLTKPNSTVPQMNKRDDETDCLQVKCEGTIRNHYYLHTIFAALLKLHNRHNQNGAYHNLCTECHSFFAASSQDHCSIHQHQHFSTGGRPTDCEKLLEFKKWLSAETRRSGYAVRKRQCLLPSDLIDIQAYIVSVNYHLQDLKHYVMMLDGIECALRFVGCRAVTFKHFNDHADLWKVKSNRGIEHIAQAVREKHDEGFSIYKLKFKPHQFAKLCALRHLLVFVHCTNHKSGHLFPENVRPFNPTQPETDSLDSITTLDDHDDDPTAASYPTILTWMQTRLKNNCRHPMDAVCKFGVHSLRRSIYFLAVLGGGIYLPIKRNVRHKHDRTATGYHEDAIVLADDIKNNPVLLALQPIWPFEDKLLCNAGRNFSRVQAFDPSDVKFTTLHQIAQYFVTQTLGVNPSHSYFRDPRYLLELSYAMDCTQCQIAETFAEFVSTEVPLPSQQKAIELFQAGVADAIKQYVQSTRNPNSQGQVNAATSPATDNSPSTAPQTATSPLELPPVPVAGSSVSLLMISIDEDGSRGKRLPLYRLHSPILKALRTEEGPRLVAALYRLTHELATLEYDPMHPDTSFEKRYKKGVARLRPNRQIFPAFMTAFAKCMICCHKLDLDSYLRNFPNCRTNNIVPCTSCR